MNIIDSLFTWFLTATMRASLLALAVLALQMALRRRLPARWRYALWLPVLLVLAAPMLPQSRWSVENYVQPKVVVMAPVAPKVEPVEASEAAIPATVVAVKADLDWRRIGMLAWLAGAGVMLVLGAISYARALRRMRGGEVPVGVALRSLLADVAAECGLRRVPRVLVSAAVSSPAVTGLLRPLLLLPAEVQSEFSREEVRLILLHELTHLRRHDLALNWVLCLLQVLHWCNPVVWLALARMRADREAACDEQVLATTEGESRAEYGHVLLRLAMAPSLAAAPRPAGFTLGFVGIFGPASAIRSRIVAIARYRREHAAWRVIGVALIAGLAIAGATRAPRAEADAEAGVKKEEGAKAFVEIDAKFISVAGKAGQLHISGERMGIPTVGTPWAVQGPEDFQEFMRQLTKDGQVLSSPRVTTRDGNSATLDIVEQYLPEADGKNSKERKFIGYSLEATPRLEGKVLSLEIVATANSATDNKTGKPVTGPIKDWSQVTVNTRKLTTTQNVAPGQSLVLIEPDGKDVPSLFVTVSPKVLGEVEVPARNGPPPAISGEARLEEPKADAPKVEAPEKVSSLVAKAGALTIAKIDIREVTLAEAVQTLSDLAKAADPDKKGVPMVLDPSVKSDAHITLSLSNVPVIEALKYITNLAETKFRFEGEKVVIVPMDAK